jgi:hypothetical protein
MGHLVLSVMRSHMSFDELDEALAQLAGPYCAIPLSRRPGSALPTRYVNDGLPNHSD